MSRAPANPKLRKAIRQAVEANFHSLTEKVLFLGREGELREVGYPIDGEEKVRAIRDRMVAAGSLGAVVHMCVAKADSHGYYSLVEVFDDPAHPTRHALINWTSQTVWTQVPEELEEGDAPGET